MADFTQFEEADAVRLTWNCWPNSKLEATKCIVPFAALYTPNKRTSQLQVMQYEPIPCKGCGAMLNPFCQVDFTAKIWQCPFCHARNHFPAHYQGIAADNVPAELFPEFSTIEYTLPRATPPGPPCYVFIIDTAVADDELEACKQAILKAITLIPEYCMVGLVTFGMHVQVHELGFQELPKSYIFRGSKDYTAQQIAEQLRVGARGMQRTAQGAAPNAAAGRFLLPLSECEFQITSILEELQRDAFPAVAAHRPSRCTGTAIQVAAAMMTALLPPASCAQRMMLFVGGPCTEGSGAVVTTALADEIRSHKDLAKDAAPYWRKACKFYEGIATQLTQQGQVLDVFACALNQVGLAEMKVAIQQSGGTVLQADTYRNPVFSESLERMFIQAEDQEGFLGTSSNATFEVMVSRDIKVAGLLGPASRMEKKSAAIADQQIGLGGTTSWKLCNLDLQTTLTVFFDVTATSRDTSDGMAQANPPFCLQFITRYLHWSGTTRCRVTTISRSWVDASPASLNHLMSGFDQECAAAVMARLATHKMETEEDFDATRWLDRNLIRLSQRFGEYRKDDPQSFTLSSSFSFYPQFMFHLRRSQFVQVFGNSPDETAYFRLLLFREPCADALVMIQPSLIAYTFNTPPAPVMLDVQSIVPDHILFLDAYFYVVVFHGQTIAQWRKAGYQHQEEYGNFKELLQAPQAHARAIMNRRYPVPRLVDCDYQGSQARFLLAKLNPSATYNTDNNAMSGEVINTDDVSLQVFMEHLKKLAVAS